jgi:hypothetical protein
MPAISDGKGGWRLDRKVTATMVEDMLFDPILAAKVILKVRLPPHEELRLLWMWTTPYSNDDSGFSTGKSWTFALVAALRSILIPERVSGVLSKTFAQGKLIFANFDRWYNTSPIFRGCIKHYGNKPRLVHGQDAWVAYFRGGSTVRVLPPNFMQDAERLRSERWHDGYFDEWTTYGNFKAFNTTIIGRVVNVNKYKDCPVRMNHVHMASTPASEDHPAYGMVRRVDYQCAIGNKDYGRFTVNYRHVPDNEEWSWLVNRKIVFHMQTNLPKGIVRSEVDGLWAKESSCYYDYVTVNAARYSKLPIIKKRRNPNQIFIAGVDIAAGGGDATSATKGDDCSLTVLSYEPGDLPEHAFTIRKSKITDRQFSGIIHKWHRILGFSFIVSDPGGGGLFLNNRLKEREQMIDNELVSCTPIITHSDLSGTIGSQVIVSFSRSDAFITQMWGKMQSDSVLVNKAHKELKGAIENRIIRLGPEWSGWEGNSSNWDIATKREHLNRKQGLKDDDVLAAERDLAVCQLISVDPKRDTNGVPLRDSFGMFNFKSKFKKDAAYSLLYSYCGYLLSRFYSEDGEGSDNSDDNRDVIYSSEAI